MIGSIPKEIATSQVQLISDTEHPYWKKFSDDELRELVLRQVDKHEGSKYVDHCLIRVLCGLSKDSLRTSLKNTKRGFYIALLCSACSCEIHPVKSKH